MGSVENYVDPHKFIDVNTHPWLRRIVHNITDLPFLLFGSSLLMLFLLIIIMFFYKPMRPKKPLIFYPIFILPNAILIGLGVWLFVKIQIPIADDYLDSINFYLEFKKHPILVLVLPFYHVVLDSFISIWYYRFLIKNEF
ncbi:MAG: hypothetical protein JNM67_04650 [Bacteroidetes bacterium]|nr:hypothetical protein [Bacteroidota bacterium]